MASAYPKTYFGNTIGPTDLATLKVTSSAVLYGLSVYTVFPVCIDERGQRVAFSLSRHFDRLCQSSHIIGIDTFASEWTYAKFEEVVRKLLAANDVKKDVFVRATVHVTADIAGPRSRGLKTELSMFVYPAETILPASGARLKTSTWRRVPDLSIPARAKVNGAYVNSVLAKQEALDSGCDDCVFVDAQGHVCELSAANIFIVRHGRIITPDTTSDILEGINRRAVIELAEDELGIKVIERSIDLTELYIADEVFATGTSANIAPIIEVDKRRVGDGKVGPVTKKLQKFHTDLLHGRLPDHEARLTVC